MTKKEKDQIQVDLGLKEQKEPIEGKYFGSDSVQRFELQKRITDSVIQLEHKKHFFRNATTQAFTPFRKEHTNQTSLTVPGQSMSITEIIDRFTRGLPMGNYNTPVFYGEHEVPDFVNMDLADREQYIKDIQSDINGYRQRLAENEKTRKKLDAEIAKQEWLLNRDPKALGSSQQKPNQGFADQQGANPGPGKNSGS